MLKKGNWAKTGLLRVRSLLVALVIVGSEEPNSILRKERQHRTFLDMKIPRNSTPTWASVYNSFMMLYRNLGSSLGSDSSLICRLLVEVGLCRHRELSSSTRPTLIMNVHTIQSHNATRIPLVVLLTELTYYVVLGESERLRRGQVPMHWSPLHWKTLSSFPSRHGLRGRISSA